MQSVFWHITNKIVDKIKNTYESSLLNKVIMSISKSISKLINNSWISNFLSNNNIFNNTYKNSITYKVLYFPFKLLHSIANNTSTKKCKNQTVNGILDFFKNIFDYSIQDIGHLAFALSLGATIPAIIFGHKYFWIPLIISFILSIINTSITKLLYSSKSFKFISNCFFDNIEIDNHNIKKISSLLIYMAIFFIVGAVSGCFSFIIPYALFIGVILIGVCLFNLEFSVILTITLIPFMPTSILILLVGISIVSFIIKLSTDVNFKLYHSSLYFSIVLLIVFIIISTITSVSIIDSLKLGLIYILFALFFVVAYNTIRNKRLWNLTLNLVILSSLLVCLYGIIQYFFIGETTSSWVDTSSFNYISTRVYSTLNNPNTLGEYIILTLPIAFAMLWTKKDELGKFTNLLINLVMIACLIFTWSRGAWLGVIIAIAFFIIRKDKFWLGICILAIFIIPTIIPTEIIQRLLSTGSLTDSSTTYRISVWTASIQIIKDYWLTGIGLSSNAFMEILPTYAFDGANYALHAHSFYFQFIIDMGIGGLITLISIILNTFKHVVQTNKKSTSTKTIVIAMGCGFLGLLFQGIGENIWYYNKMMLFFWSYLALIAAGSNISNNQNVEENDD